MALPKLDYSQIDYSVDLNPLAEQYGVARDDLAEQRDIYWQQREKDFRAQNPGAHVAEDSLGAIAQMQGKAALNQNDAYGNNSGSPTQAWNAQPAAPAQPPAAGPDPAGPTSPGSPTPPAGLDPSLPVTEPGNTTPTTAKRSALYDLLMQRIGQPITPDRNDPTIRGQADAYSANAERAKRNYLADIAEKGGPYMNLTGEQRLASEHAGSASAAFEAQLMGREQDARRESIRSDLALYGGLLSDDEKLQLTEELGLLGAKNEAQGISNNYALGLASDATNRYGIDKTAATNKYNTDTDMDKFLRELGLRQWDTTDTSALNWAKLAGGQQ